MKTSEIKKLLDSFYRGETSQSDELLLFKYFNQVELADELIDEKEIFLQFYESDSIPIPQSLESNLTSLIEELDEKETQKTEKKTDKKRIILFTSIAASIALLITTGIYTSNTSLKGDNTALAQEAERKQAEHSGLLTSSEFKEAEEAIRLLSTNFNKGIMQLDSLGNNLDSLSNTIEERNRTANDSLRNK